MDTNRGVVKVGEKKVAKALGLRQKLFGLHAGSSVSARAFPSPVSYLNFLQWVGRGGLHFPLSG